MVNKRGLSTVVTTVLIIMLVLVSLAIIWGVVSTFIIKGSQQLSIEKFTVNMEIKSAVINYTSGILAVKVKRNEGFGEVVGIKILVSDNLNTVVFEESFSSFNELAEYTFMLDISTINSNLDPAEITDVSIVPIILSNGEEILGATTDTIGNLDENPPEIDQTGLCSEDSDCPNSQIIDGTEQCVGNSIFKQKRDYLCNPFGECSPEISLISMENCESSGEICVESPVECSIAATPCTIEADCGTDGYIGVTSCSNTEEAIVQDWKDYSCVNLECESTVTTQPNPTCLSGDECKFFDGTPQCFTPVECASNDECDTLYGPGKICNSNGDCETEVVVDSGTVGSIWPFTLGEYFDSTNLPRDPQGISYIGYRIIFTSGLEQRCLTITEHVYPENQADNAYVRLNYQETDIESGNTYEIWETDYICSTP